MTTLVVSKAVYRKLQRVASAQEISIAEALRLAVNDYCAPRKQNQTKQEVSRLDLNSKLNTQN